ncbi:MAG TPA: hypothetical protein PLZ36_07190 [Armatimonadota bacterium]|nr:hypothetical protein [Armatimonadota bacterium]HOS42456.1 hypothetical protein [Armatimonadota bacterium]
MRWQTGLAWGAALWLAAGVEGALGGGAPGPLFLLPLAAGLAGGPVTGLLVGAGAALLASAAGGPALALIALLTLGAGLGAGLLTRWVSARNLLVAGLAAFAASALAALLLALAAGQPPGEAGSFALRRGGVHALWMVAIYSIILVMSPRTVPRERREE